MTANATANLADFMGFLRLRLTLHRSAGTNFVPAEIPGAEYEYTFSHHQNAVVKKFFAVHRKWSKRFRSDREDYDLEAGNVRRFREVSPAIAPEGASAVERLKIRLVFKGYSFPPSPGPSWATSAINALNAMRASSACDICMVVNGGIVNSDRRMSSKPTTDKSLGTLMPKS